ncbi:MAG TPA: hypothetical protein VN444_04530 [Verrucomicrobiae bacterium]|nr:hypothetical protein [Verrucomicrobiae bacterium]
MKAALLIDKLTNTLDGTIIVSVDSDIDFVQPTDAHDVLTIPTDHPAVYEQLEWEAPKKILLGAEWGRELKRKVREPIVPPSEARRSDREPTT